MSRGLQYDVAEEEEEENEDFLGDAGLGQDLEALRQACLRTGTTLDEDDNDGASAPSSSSAPAANATDYDYSDSDDDLELVRKLQNRFSISADTVQPLCSLPPVFDDDDDDYATLCAVRKRFAAYEDNNNGFEKEVSQTRVEETPDGSEGTNLMNDNEEAEGRRSEASKLLTLDYCSFPKSGQVFIDAIKRNRLCQRFIRSKMLQINARIEENEKLKQRVAILRSFSVACNRNVGRALAQGKDHRIQLISARSSKVSNKNNSAMQTGPEENSHVAIYRKALEMFPLSLEQGKWKAKEMENLRKGIEQQYQEMVLQSSMDLFSGPEGSPGDANDLDIIISSVRDLEITPEKLREFLPKVNWDQLASLYVAGRTGAECRARWYNFGDPLINKSKWTDEEGKKLRSIVENKGLYNWPDIAASLGTNRTPFQCLARYQRTYNCLMLNSEWTEEEDAQLREAVEIYGESDWQSVAFKLKRRTGSQCSNRWKKSLDPSKPRKGKWTLEEDKRLKIAVQFFGTSDWNKIAQFVPGRTGPRCCERWSNCLDPSKKFNDWTEEEDFKLRAAFEKHGIQWAKIARECLPHRTDNACRRRCKLLYPDDVALLEEAKKNNVYPSNFVDRESERPTSYKKVILPPTIGLIQGPECVSKHRNRTTKSRGQEADSEKNFTSCNASKTTRSNKSRKTSFVTVEENDDSVNGILVCSTNLRTKHSLANCNSLSGQDCLLKNSVQNPSVSSNGTGFDSRKKSLPEPQSKSREIVEKDCTQNLFLVPAGSSELESELKEDDGFETVGRSDSSFSTRRNDNHYSRTSEGAPVIGNPVPLEISNDESDLIDDHLDSNLLCINDEQDIILHKSENSGEKRVFEPCSSDDGWQALSFPKSRELRTISSEDAEKSSFDDLGKERGAYKHSGKRKRIAGTNGDSGHDTVPCKQDRCKKLKPRVKSNSNQVLKLADEDVPLAIFLGNKPKRRLEEFQNANQVCSVNMNPGPEFLSREAADRPVNGNKILSLRDEAQTYSNEVSEHIPYCEEHQMHLQSITDNGKEPCVADAFEQSSNRKRIGEPRGIGGHVTSVPCKQDGRKKLKRRAKSNSYPVLKLADEEDVPLAVFLGNKSKKKRPEEDQNNRRVCSANMKPGPEFFSREAADQLDNGNKTLSLQGEPQICSNGVSEDSPFCEGHQKHMQTGGGDSKEPHVADAMNGRMITSQEPGDEQMSVTVGSHSDADDVPLATLFHKKQKKRS